jgi:hypothetical protein
MRKYLDDKDIINAIRLELRHPSGKERIWVLVEGIDDQKLFSKLIDGPHTRVNQANGGLSALHKAIAVLTEETNQVIGIRDADFLRLEQKTSEHNSLFITDFHDAEMMMVMSDIAFQAVISEYLNPQLNEFKDIREEILGKLEFLGGIRFYNQINNFSINFKDLSIIEILDSDNNEIDKENCIDYLIQRSPNFNHGLKSSAIEQIIQDINDLAELCCGHDFNKFLAFIVTKESKPGVSDKDISKALRLAFSKNEFSKTHLYNDLKSWENISGYILFSEN